MRSVPSFGLMSALVLVGLSGGMACGSSDDDDNGAGGSGGAAAGSGGNGGSSSGRAGNTSKGGRAGAGSGGSDAGSGGEAGAEGDGDSGAGGNGSDSGGSDGSGGSGGSGGGATPLLPGLWYGGVSLCAFAQEQLEQSSDDAPELAVALPSLTAVLDVALDERGYVWVVGTGSNSVFRYTAEALADPDSAAPDLELTSDELSDPGNLVFDADGGLWVATRPPLEDNQIVDGKILHFEIPDDASGVLELSPEAELASIVSGDLAQIGGIEFDANDNLWASSLVGLVRFDDPLDLSDAASVEPGAVIEKTGYPNNIHFYSVAFDERGDLWAASGDGLHYLTSVTKFADPGSFAGRSSPDRAVSILGAADLLPAGGLAFDSAGDLWMATGLTLFKYSSPGDLEGDVDPSPSVEITLKGEATPNTSSHLRYVPTP